jgi:uncharacterized DUF497 family protein
MVQPDEFDDFEWDEKKSRATLAERGVDFETAALVFDGIYVQWRDLRYEYDEPRYLVTGEADGIILTVAWTPRGRKRRIITTWPATSKEERIYREHRKKIHPGNP